MDQNDLKIINTWLPDSIDFVVLIANIKAK